MASNAHTRQYSYNSAEWTLTSSNRGLATTLENEQQVMATQNANQQLDFQLQQSKLEEKAGDLTTDYISDTLQAAISGATSGGLVGGVVGAVGAGVGGGIGLYNSIKAATDALKVAQNISTATLRNNQALAYGTTARNIELASYINSGNYYNTIQGIEAGYADAALIPPSTVANSGGDGFRYGIGLLFSFTIRYKRITDDALIRCAQFFRRFGYRINQYMMMPRYLNFCELYTYWKCQEIYIESINADETERDAMRGIMCRGTTIWGNPANIGTTSIMSNTVRSERMGAYY